MPTVLSKFDPKEANSKRPKSDDGQSRLSPDSSDQLKKHETELTKSSKPSQGKIFVPRSDKDLGLELKNGQMRLDTVNWESGDTTFIMSNQVDGTPKGGLEVTLENDHLIRTEFRIPAGFPDDMSGFMFVLQNLFWKPKEVGIVEMKIGCEAVKEEVNKTKGQECHISWTSPWDNAGCRVSWMKENDDSMIKYKFVNINKLGADEEMIMTVDESHEFYKKISSDDPVSITKDPLQTCLLTNNRTSMENGWECQYEFGCECNGRCVTTKRPTACSTSYPRLSHLLTQLRLNQSARRRTLRSSSNYNRNRSRNRDRNRDRNRNRNRQPPANSRCPCRSDQTRPTLRRSLKQ